MITTYKIPLIAQAQQFQITILGVDYTLLVVWNPVMACWVLDILDPLLVPILTGIPIVTGVDLLGQYEHLNFGGGLIALSSPDRYVVPSLTSLGDSSQLYFVTW